MVQVTFDTNKDSIEELEQAKTVLEQAISRRKGLPAFQATAAKMDMPPVEDTAVDTPFLKITVKSDEPGPAAPTLNQLLHDESLTEDELGRLFKENTRLEEEHESEEHKPKAKKEEKEEEKEEKKDAAPYIEIVEYDEKS